MRKATDWNHDVHELPAKCPKSHFILHLLLNHSNVLRPFWYFFDVNPIVYPIDLFIFLPMSMCIYRAVDRKTHKVEKTGLCTGRGSVYIANLGVEMPRATRNESPCRIFTQWMGPTPTLHTEFGWYLRTFGMVYYGDSSNYKKYISSFH